MYLFSLSIVNKFHYFITNFDRPTSIITFGGKIKIVTFLSNLIFRWYPSKLVVKYTIINTLVYEFQLWWKSYFQNMCLRNVCLDLVHCTFFIFLSDFIWQVLPIDFRQKIRIRERAILSSFQCLTCGWNANFGKIPV